MGIEIELDEDVVEKLDAHRDPDQSYGEFIEELVRIYETEGTFTTEGYSE